MKINKILLVDDEQHVRRIAEISLTNLGKWQVVVASSGREALDVAVQEQPDLILLDVKMPDMDGVETWHKLRESPQLAHIPVILLTASATEDELKEFRALGILGTILKPFSPVKLPDEIRSLAKLVVPPNQQSNQQEGS